MVDAAAPVVAAVEDPNAIVADIGAGGVLRASSRTAPLVPVEPGAAHLEPGSRLVVPAGAKVVVHRGAERATVSGAADLVVGGSSGALLEARGGRISVDGAPTFIQLTVPGGTITVRGTSAAPASADVVLDNHETDVFSRAGTTELKGRKSVKTLTGREAAWLEDSGAVEKSIVTTEPPQFIMSGGESATLHTTRVPTPVLVRVDPACGAGAYVEVARGGRFLPVGLADAPEEGAQERAVVLSFGDGSHAYRVRCPDQPAAGSSGEVRIRRDSGAVRLPRTPGRNALHADGRRYSVLYQNLLPELTLDWPEAPAGEALTLKVREGKDRLDEIAVGTSSYTFSSGKLGDGTYGFWFEVQRDPRLRSLETTVADRLRQRGAHGRDPRAGRRRSAGRRQGGRLGSGRRRRARERGRHGHPARRPVPVPRRGRGVAGRSLHRHPDRPPDARSRLLPSQDWRHLTQAGPDLVGRTVLGRYRVVRAIGRGGMGVIYLARSEGAAGFIKPFVIKQAAPEAAAATP